MDNIRILWTDDEIDLLKPHILFLENKGYTVDTASNGDDAIELVKSNSFDLIFLDENMPGKSGLEILREIKSIFPSIPIVMITKSEAEDIMEAAIGSQIADYLIKPVNPNQILLTIKKNIDHQRLVTKKNTADYQAEFGKIGMDISYANSWQDWIDIYKKVTYWELEMDKSNENAMDEVLKMQKTEANNSFFRYISKNYFNWFEGEGEDTPLLSPNVFRKKVFPSLNRGEKTFVIVIDNLRFDQWKVIQPLIRDFFYMEEEDLFCSILPTATQYARNAMFAGLMPAEIHKMYPDLWVDEDAEGSKNSNEEALLEKQLKRFNINKKFHYDKIKHNWEGKKIVDNLTNIIHNDLTVLVYNFVDMLSHARTELQMIRELASDESAYRSLTLSWFRHSPLLDLLKKLSDQNVKVIITTDHGMVKVHNPIKVVGDRNTTTNLRYKQGKSLNYKPKEVFEVTDPAKAHLPKTNISSSYIFATGEDFFAYPNNFNHYVKYYRDTFQHGGISMEEMLIPVITLKSKK
ncbi:MAG: two-component system response regulator [Marinilabiliales bacterium]|nr:MAG: two-component system response regulator [Marinilabiliales bacterium]